jgi:hypothetical protein
MYTTFKEGQISVVKDLRAKLGLGLREAYDITQKYPNLSADAIVAKLQPQQASAPTEHFSSNLTVRGYVVVSKRFPELNGYHEQLLDDAREKLRQDKDAAIRELVYKAEADELIGNLQRLAQ